MRVGLVSDTHGLCDRGLSGAFAGCAAILHAGDVVKPAVLDELSRIAPVTAVRGNNDAGLGGLPETALVPIGALTALLVHDLGPRERPRPPAQPILLRARPEIVVHGHSHRPGAALLDSRLFVNPGSAGPRRFSLPRTAAVLIVRGRSVRVEFLELAAHGIAPFGQAVEAML